MKPNIGLLGQNGAGKTTIADYLVAEHGYRKLSFAEPLRELARLNPQWHEMEGQFGYPEAKGRLPWFRQYLIDLGEGIRKYDPVYFVKALAQRITDMDPEKPWVIDDVRKQVEVNFLNDMGFRFMFVVRDERPVDWDLQIPTRVMVLRNWTGLQASAQIRLGTLLRAAEWAAGTPHLKEETDADSPPVHEQRPDPESSGGSADGGAGGDTPHWCARCRQEFERNPSARNLAELEARSRRYARQGRRHHHDGEGLGATPEVCDGQGDALCDHPARCGGVVLNPSGWPGDVRPDRK